MASNEAEMTDLVLRLEGVAKSFGATRAVRDAAMAVRRGEVHCIVGENGSGKSTVVKILSGIHRPDAGKLEVSGQPVSSFGSPKAAFRAGIATVFQEVLVVEPRSVLENVWLGFDGLFRTLLNADERRDRARTMLADLLGASLPLDAPVESLSLSQRQACCIARALVREPRLLILDEATSALDVETRDRLFAVIRRLSADGMATIFISHRMDEIAEIGDRCTVMRSGETVATLERGEADARELVRLMTGTDHLAPADAREASARSVPGEVVMRTEALCLRPGAAPVDFELRAGELVGLAGLEGHGQDAFIKALWGIGADGAVHAGAERVSSPRAASALGIGYVPRERRAESLFESKSIRENFALPTLARDVRGLLWPAASSRRLEPWVERLSIKLGSPNDVISTLSGGNQQKVVMARWLATEPRVLLLNDPTRGVDIGAKRDLYRLLASLATDGVAIVMLSTEVDEHVELMDRVLVFREHAVFVELSRAELDRNALVSAYFGRSEHDQREQARA